MELHGIRAVLGVGEGVLLSVYVCTWGVWIDAKFKSVALKSVVNY